MTKDETIEIAKNEAKSETGCLAMFVLILIAAISFGAFKIIDRFENIEARVKALDGKDWKP